MSAKSVRAHLKQILSEELPSEWLVIPHQTTPKVIDRITVVLSQTRIEPLPEAPSQLVVSATVTVISPFADEARAETDLDDAVLELVYALSDRSDIQWTDATKTVAGNEQNAAWDVAVRIITNKKEV